MKISRHSTDRGDYGFHTRCHFCLCLACPTLLTFYMIPAHKRRHMRLGKGPVSHYFIFYETTNTTVLQALEMKYNLRNVIHYHYNRISIKIIKGKQEKIGPESYRPTGALVNTEENNFRMKLKGYFQCTAEGLTTQICCTAPENIA